MGASQNSTQAQNNPASSSYPQEANFSQFQNQSSKIQPGSENNLMPLLMSVLSKGNSSNILSEILGQKKKDDSPATPPKNEILL